MTVDAAILMLLADLQRTIEALRAENVQLREALTEKEQP